MRHQLRPYQVEAITRARECFRRGLSRIVIVAPTGCLSGDTMIGVNRAGKSFRLRLSEVVRRFNGGAASGKVWDPKTPTMVRRMSADGTIRLGKLKAAYESGPKEIYRLSTADHTIDATADHRFLTDRGWLRLSEIRLTDIVHMEDKNRKALSKQPKRYDKHIGGLYLHPFARRRGVKSGKGGYSIPLPRLTLEALLNNRTIEEHTKLIRQGRHWGSRFIDPDSYEVHHKDGNWRNNHPSNLELLTPEEHRARHTGDSSRAVAYRTKKAPVVKIHYLGIAQTYDLELEDDPHNFLANGIVVHNSGKTTIAAAMIESMIAKGKRCIFLAHTTELITQCSLRLDATGVDHGVIKSGHPRVRPWLPVQVASVQTLVRRETPAPADILFVDECHRSMANSYRKIIDAYPAAVTVGLTATPWRLDGKGLGDIYQELVVAAQPAALIREGFILEPRLLAPPTVSLAGIRVVRGDYDQRALSERYSKSKITGDIVSHWLEHAQGRPTIVFASSIAHAKDLTIAFRGVGILAGHVSGETPPNERSEILTAFAAGKITLVTCADLLTEGYDLPALGCVVLARPTKSLTKFLQMVGRALRPLPGKSMPVILDHAGCYHDHGWPTLDREYALEASKPKQPSDTHKVCSTCFEVIPVAAASCPHCGAVCVIAHDRTGPTVQDGILLEVARSEDYRTGLDLSCLSCGVTCMLAFSRPDRVGYKLLCPSCKREHWKNRKVVQASLAMRKAELFRLRQIAARRVSIGMWDDRKANWWVGRTYKEIFGVRAPRERNKDNAPADHGESST